jgi:hypothetical protein
VDNSKESQENAVKNIQLSLDINQFTVARETGMQ